MEKIGSLVIASLLQVVESIHQDLVAYQARRGYASFDLYLMCEEKIIQHILSVSGMVGP
jgi:hypothetical protein